MALRRSFLSADGIAHTRIQESRAENQDHKKRGKWYTKEAADICLNCTKKRCSGGYDCYANRKKSKKN